MITDGPYATAVHAVSSIDFLTLGPSSSDYPRGLLGLRYPPVLHVAGRLSPADEDAVAVVGSRTASSQAVATAAAVAAAVAAAGRTVVSGLARGVDAAAHRGALSIEGGRTIAVVATGLDLTFPPEHLELDRVIRARGAVVSSSPLGQRASRSSFLARNELITALAVATVVVVSEERSGTRSTINYTLAQRKPVLFWGPLMGELPWAQTLVSHGLAYFAASVNDVVERLSTNN
jgi:DNA processing protein